MTKHRKLITFREPHLAILEDAAPSSVARAPGDYLGALLTLHRNRWQEALRDLDVLGVPRETLHAYLRASAGRYISLRHRTGHIRLESLPPGLELVAADSVATLALCDLIDEYSAGNVALKAELEAE